MFYFRKSTVLYGLCGVPRLVWVAASPLRASGALEPELGWGFLGRLPLQPDFNPGKKLPPFGGRGLVHRPISSFDYSSFYAAASVSVDERPGKPLWFR
jgi:hypothetical protein